MTVDHEKKKTILENAQGWLRSRFARDAKTAAKSVHFGHGRRGRDHAESRFACQLHDFYARSVLPGRFQNAMSYP